MSTARQQAPAHKLGAPNLRVALCGNPNSGKTTLFNALTGMMRKVANYPGVTVETTAGTMRLGDNRCELVDIPGAYSLAATSPDERIAVEALTGRLPGESAPDVIVVVVDATKLDRGLYMTLQVMELGVPVVLGLNMYDVAQRHGIRIDHESLSAQLQIPVVPLVAHRKEGIERLKRAIWSAARAGSPPLLTPWPPAAERLITDIVDIANSNGDARLSQGEAIRLLSDDLSSDRVKLVRRRGDVFRRALETQRMRFEDLGGAGLETTLRASLAGEIAGAHSERPTDRDASWTSRLDRVLLHRVLGPVFLILMGLVVFQSIFSWAQPFIEWIDSGFAIAANWVSGVLPEGPLQSLVADGLIGGVGAVLVFLPQILILFLFIGILENTGYLPRAAFLADRVFRGCGLTGRSLIPLLSSFACAVPGVMATRSIDQRTQRMLTILVAPLVTCSARLPVYAILIAAFVPATAVAGIFNLQGVTLFGMYALGIVVAALMSLGLRYTLFRGHVSSFVMELPSYKLPNWRNITTDMYLSGRAFVTRAGTVILALTVVLWALSYYPRSETLDAEYDRRIAAASDPVVQVALEQERAGAHLAHSYLARAGRVLEPAALQLGWDWKITMAVLASFPAREVIIATLGIIYNLGEAVDAESSTLITRLQGATWDHGPRLGQPVFNIAVTLSIMVFFALCCQCLATLATIKRETNSWRWPVFVFSYMTVLATVAAYAVYHIALAVGLGGGA